MRHRSTDRRPPIRARSRSILAAAVLGAALLAACGDLEPIEFTRASTTTVVRDIEAGLDLPTTTLPTLRPARYEVQPGDSMGSIATRFGLTIDSLLAANDLQDPNRLEAGTVLRIPGPNATTPPPWLQREDRNRTGGR